MRKLFTKLISILNKDLTLQITLKTSENVALSKKIDEAMDYLKWCEDDERVITTQLGYLQNCVSKPERLTYDI